MYVLHDTYTVCNPKCFFSCIGESKVAEADKTLSFMAFTDRKSGVSGKLFLTNFKVAFVTEERSSYEGVMFSDSLFSF